MQTGSHPKAAFTALLLLAFIFTVVGPAWAIGGVYQVGKTDRAGSIRGKVRIGSAEPLVRRLPIFKDHEICGDTHRDIPLIQANGDGLLNAVVYLDDITSGKPFPAAAKKITINQLGCRFIPHLSVIANGGEIEVINSDKALHNIHAYEMIGSVSSSTFSGSQPQRGDIFNHEISLQKGSAMRILCDAHNFMLGYIFVARNPYYAVVDSDGEFLIKGVPPGDYRIMVWHGTLGQQQGTVTVAADGAVVYDFSY